MLQEHSQPRARVLQEAGLPAWKTAVDKLGEKQRDFLLLTLYTALRRNEFRTLNHTAPKTDVLHRHCVGLSYGLLDKDSQPLPLRHNCPERSELLKDRCMALLWRSQFSVGNDLIDSDHQYLLEIINRAEVCLKSVDTVALTSVLNELANYGKSHFEREELVAKAVGYPKADLLHESHTRLAEQLTKFREGMESNSTKINVDEVTTFLRDWLIQHVIKEDMLMKPWLTKHSPRFDPRQ